jgi:hypothetical protein
MVKVSDLHWVYRSTPAWDPPSCFFNESINGSTVLLCPGSELMIGKDKPFNVSVCMFVCLILIYQTNKQ